VAPLWFGFTVLGLSSDGGNAGDTSLWLLTLALLLLPRVLSVIVVVARKEAAAFGGVAQLAGSALFELLMSSLQAPLRMLAHCVYVFGALTGLKLEWKSPPRAAEAPQWGDVTRRLGGLILLPMAAGLGLLQRSAAVVLAPMWLPLSMAVPFVVLTGHPRAGGLAQRLGLLRTPEEAMRPRPLVQAAQCRSFQDLEPAPVWAAAQHPKVRSGGVRWAQAALLATTTAVLAISPRPTGFTPELPSYWRDGPQYVAVADSESVWTPEPTVEQPPPRKRVVRQRPARMIDDAVRQRALDAVKRALESEESEDSSV
jgi:membrane glycosyltransferase